MLGEPGEVVARLGRVSDGGVLDHGEDLPSGGGLQDRVGLLGGEGAAPPQEQAHPGAFDLGEQLLRGLGVLGHDGVDPGDDVRLGQLLGGLELAPVQGDGLAQRVGREVGGEGVGQAERGGEAGAEQRGAEDVQRYVGALAGGGVDPGDPGLSGEVALQFQHVLGEPVGGGGVAAQCPHGLLVAAGRPPQSQVDASGVEGLQGAVLLGDGQRRVVGQHDTAGPQADAAGVRGDVGDEHTRRRRGDGGHVVVLGVPDPPVSPLLGVLGQGDAGLQTVACRFPRADVREVENGERDCHGGAGPFVMGTEQMPGGSLPARLVYNSGAGRVISPFCGPVPLSAGPPGRGRPRFSAVRRPVVPAPR